MSKTQIPSLPVANLQQYTQLVERIPRLDDTEERELAERLRRHNDLDAARRLITSHLRYVVWIANRYRGYGLPQEDLIQEGNIGLMKAVRRFDPSRGVRLIAYAAYWIRAQIHDFILRNWRIVKVATTKAKRKLFYKLRSAKQRLEWLDKSEASQIAGALKVAPEDVVEMEAKLYLHDEPFDSHEDDTDDDVRAPAAYLADCRFEPQAVITETDFVDRAVDALDGALSKLDPRSRDIIESRWLADDGAVLTLHDLGRRYNISAERVRQLERAAINRLRRLVAPRVGVDRSEVGLRRCAGLAA
jgi:RNA polymerase sigma-32 factor